jgi:t-SNARE complex subunit (syntaxin)
MLTASDLKSIQKLLEPLQQRFNKVDAKLSEHDQKFNKIEKKLLTHDKKLGKLQSDLDVAIRFFDRDHLKLRHDYDGHMYKYHITT